MIDSVSLSMMKGGRVAIKFEALAMCSAAFLDASEHGRVVARFDIDVSVGCETGLRQRRREQVRPSYDPEDLTLCARGERRDVRFNLGTLNIVTGASKTGKSALLDIVDYCWGRTECTIAEGEIRRAVSWFAVLFDRDGEGILVARKNPGPAGKASDEIYFERNVEDFPESPDLFVKNATADGLRSRLSAILGVAENLYVPEPGATRRALEASASQAIFFCLQGQDEIANRRLLFHRQGAERIPQAIKDTLPYFVGAMGEDHYLKQKRYEDARRRLRSLERDFADAKALADEASGTARSLLQEAKRVGLLPLEMAADTVEGVRVRHGRWTAIPPADRKWRKLGRLPRRRPSLSS